MFEQTEMYFGVCVCANKVKGKNMKTDSEMEIYKRNFIVKQLKKCLIWERTFALPTVKIHFFS